MAKLYILASLLFMSDTLSPTTLQLKMIVGAEEKYHLPKRDQKVGAWPSRLPAPHCENTFALHQPLCQQVPKPPHKTAQLRRNKPTSDAAKTRCQGKWFHQVQLVKDRFTDTSQGGRDTSPWQHPSKCVNSQH